MHTKIRQVILVGWEYVHKNKAGNCLDISNSAAFSVNGILIVQLDKWCIHINTYKKYSLLRLVFVIFFFFLFLYLISFISIFFLSDDDDDDDDLAAKLERCFLGKSDTLQVQR